MELSTRTRGSRVSYTLLSSIGRTWAALAIMAMIAAAAPLCPETGEPAPAVVTLMASKTNPTSNAWIVSPNCSVEILETTPSPAERKISITVESRGVERVASVPSSVRAIFLRNNSLTHGVDLSNASNLTGAEIVGARTDYRDLIFPRYLETLLLTSHTDASISGLKLPSSLQILLLLDNANLKTLRDLQMPPWLRVLAIGDGKITADDFQFLPATLRELSISFTPIGNLEDVPLPSSLQIFECINCGIKRIRGVQWPTSLRRLYLVDEIKTFEIRQSDVETFKKISLEGTLNQTACKPSEASVATATFCVVRSYSTCIAVRNTTVRTCFMGSKYEACSGSGASSSTMARFCLILDQKLKSLDGSSEKDVPSFDFSDRSLAGTSSTAEPRDITGTTGSLSLDTSAAGTAKKGNILLPVIIILMCSGLVATALGYVIVARNRHRHVKSIDTTTMDTFALVETPNASSGGPTSSEPSTLSSGSLDIDIENDRDLVRWRINHVNIGKLIARGGYGVVYRGSYQGRAVAIKQMLPDTWKNDEAVTSFLDEIRLCARMSHPKIVEFIGATWTSLRDLSAVTAFMASGDLHSVLRAQPDSSGATWTHPWSPRNLKSKTLMAMDVADAVMYLHSLDSPIIHRDLKAKNALLDAEGHVKLSDFGISRVVSIDDTMTSEIGTVAWIAPEVLRGERYSEQADIYSLGVLLVELDRCTHPYAGEPVLSADHTGENGLSASETVHIKNTQIMILVSTGKMRPSPSQGCPASVSTLIARCVSHQPSDRPTAPEILQQLRHFAQASESGHK